MIKLRGLVYPRLDIIDGLYDYYNRIKHVRTMNTMMQDVMTSFQYGVIYAQK